MPKRIRIIPWLDTSQLKKQLEELGKEEQQVNVNIKEKGIQNTTRQVDGLSKSVKNTDSIFAKLKGTIANTFSAGKLAMTGYLLVLREISNAGQEAKRTIKEIDKAVTDLQVATNMSRESVEGLVKGYNEYGKSLASTTTDITSAADDYLRAGKSLNEAQTLIKDSIMLSKLGQIESGTATEDLLAVMNGYEMSIDEVGKALDAMVALDMEAATSSGDIATALKYCASSADVAGLSFNKLSAMLATVQEKTMQSAETVGTFMNTLLSRYRNVKIGQFVDDDGEDLSEVETILGSLDVKLRDTNQEFRSFESVIEEVALAWDGYSSVQQAAIAKAFSGTRQQNRFYALMEGYSKTLELTEVAANSAGTALDKFNNSYMNSLEAKENALQASFESMILNSDMDSVYAGILEATTALVDFINQTNLLKGTLTGLTAAGAIKTFLSIRTGINEAYISLNQFQNALNIIKQTTIPTKDFDRLLLLTNSLSTSQMKLVLASQNLTVEQKKQIVINSALSEKEKALLIQTYGLTTAETGLTTATTTMGNAFRALWNTLLANPLVLVTTLVSGAVMAWQTYKQSIEELRQATQEAANAYKESASSIEDYTKRYQELRQALIAAKGNEEETYNIKKQLLDLQTELNDKFGEEYGKINLVTDAYKDQTEAIKAYNKEAAQTFLNENRKGIKQSEKEMTKERHYNLSPVNISAFTKEGEALKEIAGQFKDQGVSLLDELGDGTYNQFSVHLNTDAQSAYDTINEFENTLRDKAEELGNEHLFDDILDISSISVNDAKGVLDDWGDIYQQSLLANIAKDDSLTSQMNEATKAVQEYNEAVLSSEDPYNDQNVQKARENLNALKAEMQNDDGSWNAKWQKYASVIEGVFNQADTRLIDFDNAIRNDSSIQELAEKLRGLDDLTLQGIADSMDDSKLQGVAAQLLKITESGDEVKEAFFELIEFADKYDVDVDELISSLTRLDYVQSSVASSAQESASAFGGWDALNEQIDAIQSSYKAIQAAQEEYNQYGYVSLDTLQALISLDSEYLACLIDENGQLQLNSLTYQNLVQAKLAEAEATAVAQAVEELSNLQKQADVQNSAACVNANAILAESLATLSGNYSAVASSAAAAAKAEALASAMAGARERGVDETDINKVMSNLNAKLAMIQNTTGSVKKSFGGLNNAVNGFSNAQKGAKKATDDTNEALKKQKEALEEQKDALEDSKKELEELYDAVQWFYDKQIDGIDDFIDKLNDANDVLEKQKEKYDNILSAIDNVYGDEIAAIQAKIDAMDKANDAAERELALEKAKQALEEARRRRAIKVKYMPLFAAM